MEYGLERGYTVERPEYTHSGEPMDPHFIERLTSIQDLSDLHGTFEASHDTLEELSGMME